MKGISEAFSVLDGTVSDRSQATEWSVSWSTSIEVNSVREVGLWAFQLSTLKEIVWSHIVESLKPMSTWVGGKSPFSEPDLVLYCGSNLNFSIGRGAHVSNGVKTSLESPVVMMVHYDLIEIIVEEIVPDITAVDEGVMEYKQGLWGKSLLNNSNFSIPVLEHVKWGVPPWFVDWFKTSKSTVASPSFKQSFGVLKGPLKVVKVIVNVLGLT